MLLSYEVVPTYAGIILAYLSFAWSVNPGYHRLVNGNGTDLVILTV